MSVTPLSSVYSTRRVATQQADMQVPPRSAVKSEPSAAETSDLRVIYAAIGQSSHCNVGFDESLVADETGKFGRPVDVSTSPVVATVNAEATTTEIYDSRTSVGSGDGRAVVHDERCTADPLRSQQQQQQSREYQHRQQRNVSAAVLSGRLPVDQNDRRAGALCGDVIISRCVVDPAAGLGSRPVRTDHAAADNDGRTVDSLRVGQLATAADADRRLTPTVLGRSKASLLLSLPDRVLLSKKVPPPPSADARRKGSYSRCEVDPAAGRARFVLIDEANGADGRPGDYVRGELLATSSSPPGAGSVAAADRPAALGRSIASSSLPSRVPKAAEAGPSGRSQHDPIPWDDNDWHWEVSDVNGNREFRRVRGPDPSSNYRRRRHQLVGQHRSVGRVGGFGGAPVFSEEDGCCWRFLVLCGWYAACCWCCECCPNGWCKWAMYTAVGVALIGAAMAWIGLLVHDLFLMNISLLGIAVVLLAGCAVMSYSIYKLRKEYRLYKHQQWLKQQPVSVIYTPRRTQDSQRSPPSAAAAAAAWTADEDTPAAVHQPYLRMTRLDSQATARSLPLHPQIDVTIASSSNNSSGSCSPATPTVDVDESRKLIGDKLRSRR